MGFIGHTCGVKVQKVQRVVAASPQVKKGRGSAAGCVEGLHRFRSGGATAPAALRVADCRYAVHSEHILKER